MNVHQPSPSWAQVMPAESRPGEQASTAKDAVSLRGCAEAAAVLRIPRLSFRKGNKTQGGMYVAKRYFTAFFDIWSTLFLK